MPNSIVSKKNVKRWWDDDGDGIGWEKGEVSGKFKKKKKKIAKESFSNWRQELIEVFDDIEDKEKKQIVDKKGIKNKIKTSAQPGGISIGEQFGETGGVIIEFDEVHEVLDIFSNLNEHEISFLSDRFIDEIVEEVFYECIDEGYEINEIQESLIEAIELNADILNEAKVTYGHDTKVKSDRLQRVKSGVKRVGKALVRGAGYATGAAVRGAKAAEKEFSSGYERGRGGSSKSKQSKKTSDSGLLSKIGSKLKKGLKTAIIKGAKSVSRGARNVARRMEDDKGKISTPDKTPPSPVHSRQGPRTPSPYRSGTSSQSTKKTELIPDPWEKSKQPSKVEKKTVSVSSTPKSGTSKRGQELRKKADEILASLRNEETELFEDDAMNSNANSSNPRASRLKMQLAKKENEKSQIMSRLAKENMKAVKTEECEILEREMTKDEKSKEDRLKVKYDDSDMKQNMIDQYGKEEGTKIYFATIRKKAMSEETDDNIPELRSRTITDGPSSTTSRKTTSKVLARMRELNKDVKKKKKKKKAVVESFENLEEKKLSRTEKRAQSADKKPGKAKTLNLIDLDANAMKPKKKGVEAEIEVKKGEKTTRTLNPQEFNKYKFKDDEKPDFKQFRSSDVFKKTLKGNKKVRNLHRGGESAGLTARGGMDKNREVVKHVKSSGFNKKRGVNFKKVHFTGDVPGKNTDDKKMKVIKNLIKAKKPKTIKFSDDHAKNLDAPERFNREGGKDKTKNRGSSTPKIKTYLTRDDGRPIRYGSGGGGVRDPKAVNKSTSPQETQRRRRTARKGMGEEFTLSND